jgi:hypothetical protein
MIKKIEHPKLWTEPICALSERMHKNLLYSVSLAYLQKHSGGFDR